MTRTLPGADIRGYYAELGVELPEWATSEASVRCFADPGAHAHDDRRLSCSVNLESGAFHCWGCGAKGGAYDAATEVFGFSPRAAIDLMVRYSLTEHRSPGGRSSRAVPRSSRSKPIGRPTPSQSTPAQLQVSEADVTSWQQQLGELAWPPRTLRPEHRRLWKPATLRHLGVGWDGRRLTIPIRGGDGELHGVLRYAPTATRTAKMIAMPGTRLGLIPHPATEPSQWIILSEGPPDMIAARTRGLPALAVPGDHAWDARWASTLDDRDVTIVMDADRAGRVAARRIERDLTGVARTVTIAELDPDRQDGYDFTDWLDAHRGLPTSTVRSQSLCNDHNRTAVTEVPRRPGQPPGQSDDGTPRRSSPPRTRRRSTTSRFRCSRCRRALNRVSGHVLEPLTREPDSAELDVEQDRLEAAISYSHSAQILANLMGGRRQCIAVARIPKFVRAQLNELRGIGVIGYARGVYRISEIALYSSCQLSALVAHHAGGSSGIPRESH